MTPQDRERIERTRFTILSAARASGAIIMLIGLWIWYGNVVRAGGHPPIGGALFAIGFVESLILPRWLIFKWRTPPNNP
ncbi:hypothetical protein CLG96_01325 [Sphingomonas oleivorans]|uniref:Uncharacterized protein n=1 Tax=Sphingomonas oleivorans TaxID=1735121 RepID=A0A2T5G0Z7_9SPHN|nr:hypothetical protein [Sphingomonas oleivorans]PTQ12817.1 hypothetical protein CLG96_01325 [Sphingomonas oleivorans]